MSLLGRWSTSGPRGVTHISCHHKNTIGGTGENKTDEQTRTMLGVNQEHKENMRHYIHVRTNASVGYSRKFHKQLECRHLTQSSSLDPIFSATVSVVDRICPWFHANSSADSPLCCPVANCLSAPFSTQLSFRVPLPLPDTARFQVQKSFVWFRAKTDKGIVCSGHPYSATLWRKQQAENMHVRNIRNKS